MKKFPAIILSLSMLLSSATYIASATQTALDISTFASAATETYTSGGVSVEIASGVIADGAVFNASTTIGLLSTDIKYKQYDISFADSTGVEIIPTDTFTLTLPINANATNINVYEVASNATETAISYTLGNKCIIIENASVGTFKVTQNRYLRGDINGDGTVNSKDVIMLKLYLLDPTSLTLAQDADLNGDGTITSADVAAVAQCVSVSTPEKISLAEAGLPDVQIECISGTADSYSAADGVLTFTGITADSVYSITGEMTGNIVIDVPEDYKFELEMTGFTITCDSTNPITALSGDRVTLTAKKGTDNYIYDTRAAIDETDTTLKSGAIHSEVDLRIGGKGNLTVVSDNNNGIHTKDDLEVKNLTLSVNCVDNALKGNDSVTVESGTLTLIARKGDGIKTTNSDISTKGNQRGTITISGGTIDVYAACDGLDASYNVVVDGTATATEPVLNIYTDRYSPYSEEVTATAESVYYIRNRSNAYTYSVVYYNSESDEIWVNATYHSTVSNYYYYSFPKNTAYAQMQIFAYASGTAQGQSNTYAFSSDLMSLNTAYDTYAFSQRGSTYSGSWTNYGTTTGPGGMGGGMGGGMQEGNSDKGDYSTKGIKAANEIVVTNGAVNIQSYDDSFHADNTAVLENGETPLGNITINGGTVTAYSHDDGFHAEGVLAFYAGDVSVTNSYEATEGYQVIIGGGTLNLTASDDGINSISTSGTGITLSGGYLYLYAGGDGLDSNSTTSYSAISFEGGDAVIISSGNGNSSIDSDGGYKYSAGSVVAIMSNGGMTNEATHCSNFSTIGTSSTKSFTSGTTYTVSGDLNVSFTMPCSISNAFVVILNKSTTIS